MQTKQVIIDLIRINYKQFSTLLIKDLIRNKNECKAGYCCKNKIPR